MIRNILFLITTVIVLGVINLLIVQKERLLTNGQTVFLRLAPVDPTSLMQGDYMALRYSNDTFPSEERLLRADGKIVVTLDQNRVATFNRIYNGEPLLANEVLIRYRKRTSVRFAQDSFLIQERTGDIYSRAKYAEAKVDNNGETILVALCDEQFARLGPARK